MSFAVFNCITIPFNVAFDPDAMNIDMYSYLNYVIDFLFFLDILVAFRTAYINDLGIEINKPLDIAIEYLKSSFWIDLAATVPIDQIAQALVS